jgi:hypothetical protein
MSIDENIAFLQAQQKLFEALKDSADAKVQEFRKRLDTATREISENRRKVRVLKRALVSDERLPSEAILARRLVLEAKLQSIGDFSQLLEEKLEGLGHIAEEWGRTEHKLKALPGSGLSDADEKKIDFFESSFVSQADEYRIKSLNPRTLKISGDSYRPAYQDYDLQSDLSASDAVRATWAYMVGLLETARKFPTNHPGLLLLDEPRQQSAAVQSLRDLLRRLSDGSGSQQVIVATSEDIAELQSSLAGLPHSFLPLLGRALQPLADEFG